MTSLGERIGIGCLSCLLVAGLLVALILAPHEPPLPRLVIRPAAPQKPADPSSFLFAPGYGPLSPTGPLLSPNPYNP